MRFRSLAERFRGRVPAALREEFLTKLSGYLGVRCGGCLIKGNNFGIRILEEEKQQQVTKPYQAMGKLFAEGIGGVLSSLPRTKYLF